MVSGAGTSVDIRSISSVKRPLARPRFVSSRAKRCNRGFRATIIQGAPFYSSALTSHSIASSGASIKSVGRFSSNPSLNLATAASGRLNSKGCCTKRGCRSLRGHDPAIRHAWGDGTGGVYAAAVGLAAGVRRDHDLQSGYVSTVGRRGVESRRDTPGQRSSKLGEAHGWGGVVGRNMAASGGHDSSVAYGGLAWRIDGVGHNRGVATLEASETPRVRRS